MKDHTLNKGPMLAVSAEKKAFLGNGHSSSTRACTLAERLVCDVLGDSLAEGDFGTPQEIIN